MTSHQVVLFEVGLEYGVADGGEYESDILRVGSASEVAVDDLLLVRIELYEHGQDELSSRVCVLLRTFKEMKNYWLESFFIYV